jgi:hypothetical protein
MKTGTLAAAALLGAACIAAPALAADYAVVVQDITVDRPADAVWAKVGGYCAIGDWLKIKCVYTSGSGDVGTVRRLADRIDEVMVAKTARSYSYTQPTTTILYHGTIEVQPIDGRRSKIIYTLFWDQAALPTPEAKQQDRDSRTARFKAALETMKAQSEAK